MALQAHGAAIAMVVAGCSSGTVSGQSGGSGGQGAAQRVGTLVMLGQSDIFDPDTVSAYYTVSSMLERMFTRRLFTYGDPTGAAARRPWYAGATWWLRVLPWSRPIEESVRAVDSGRPAG